MNRQRRHVALVTCVALALLGPWLGIRFYGAKHGPAARLTDQEFWELVVSFSEPGREFRSAGAIRTDNLVSNERSFQQVIPALKNDVRRGAYLGVGPEQNFTYITALKPTLAFVIDIRRDNMLLHLMYKALIEMSADRVEFLSRLFARPRPAGAAQESTVQAIFDAFKPIPRSEELASKHLLAILDRLERVHGFTLSREDERSIKAAYDSFCTSGPDIRWDSSGDPWIPSYVDLMAETDLRGQRHSYLASAENFRILKEYESNNHIVPLVGDFAGDKTIRALGRYLTSRGVTVSTFYTSNVEGYLQGSGPIQFIENVSALPLDERSLFIHTRFKTVGFAQSRPQYQTETTTDGIVPWVNAFKTSSTR